ncbi:hypothetical protein VTK73DRAFT_2007 [Phialemonium thermophilum]|uniref:Chromosome transmission fidelity protein 4 n=1 Tax=Phialemonium thermophilum TaxID=223376 RepID=A0ABR3X6P6_9PEZI
MNALAHTQGQMSASNKLLLQSSSRALRPFSTAVVTGSVLCSAEWAGVANLSSNSSSSYPFPPTNSSVKPLATNAVSRSQILWFNVSFPHNGNELRQQQGPGKLPGDKKVKLGHTLRILQERLPTLLESPLPQEVLSPNISLHLFPSTHPHLPAVSGRVAYKAALWTSPIAWNRMPVVGNVRLEILSERMVRGRVSRRPGAIDEQLIVRWRTIGGKGRRNWGLSFLNSGSEAGSNGVGDTGGAAKIGEKAMEGRLRQAETSTSASDDGPFAPSRRDDLVAGERSDEDKEFTGLFIFEFDTEGRILSHTIEHVQESGNWDQGMGARVVGLTDWLLGGMKGGREGSDTPCPAFARKGR